jgi:hypothetical protein
MLSHWRQRDEELQPPIIKDGGVAVVTAMGASRIRRSAGHGPPRARLDTLIAIISDRVSHLTPRDAKHLSLRYYLLPSDSRANVFSL